MIIFDQTVVQKGKISRPKNWYRGVHEFYFASKRDVLMLKMGAKPQPHELYMVSGSKGPCRKNCEEMATNCEEQGRTARTLNADLLYGVAGTYGC